MLTSLLSISSVKQLIKGAQVHSSAAVRIDSRQVQSGDVFVGLKGTQVDGNDYWQAAIDNGAVLLVLEDVPDDAGLSLIEAAGVGLVLVLVLVIGSVLIRVLSLSCVGMFVLFSVWLLVLFVFLLLV